MLMLRSIVLAINLNLKISRKILTLQVFVVLCTWLVSPPGIYGTCLLPVPLMLLTATCSERVNTIRRLFVFIRVELQVLLISRPP